MRPLISITIPSFKKKFLKEAIKSIVAQTYDNWELIIVDDASPEDIKSTVSQFPDTRIRYYRNANNLGALNVVDNWNKCLELCKGDYVICMGDDDMLPECALMEYTKLIEKYPKLNVYHALTIVINEDGDIIGRQRNRPEYQTAEQLILHRWLGDIQFIGDFCYSVKHLRQHGGYYKLPLAWASDDITAVRAAEENGIANMQIPGFMYRQNSLSISSSNNNLLKLDAKACELLWYSEYFNRHNNVSQELYPKAFNNWFNGQIELHIIQSFEESLLHLSDVLSKSKKLGWRKRKIISLWWRVFKRTIKF